MQQKPILDIYDDKLRYRDDYEPKTWFFYELHRVSEIQFTPNNSSIIEGDEYSADVNLISRDVSIENSKGVFSYIICYKLKIKCTDTTGKKAFNFNCEFSLYIEEGVKNSSVDAQAKEQVSNVFGYMSEIWDSVKIWDSISTRTYSNFT